MTTRIYDRGRDERSDIDSESLARDAEALQQMDPVIRQKWIDEALRRNALMESGEDPGLTLEEFWSDAEDD